MSFGIDAFFRVALNDADVLYGNDDVTFRDASKVPGFRILTLLSKTGCVSTTKLAMEMRTNIKEMYP